MPESIAIDQVVRELKGKTIENIEWDMRYGEGSMTEIFF